MTTDSNLAARVKQAADTLRKHALSGRTMLLMTAAVPTVALAALNGGPHLTEIAKGIRNGDAVAVAIGVAIVTACTVASLALQFRNSHNTVNAQLANTASRFGAIEDAIDNLNALLRQSESDRAELMKLRDFLRSSLHQVDDTEKLWQTRYRTDLFTANPLYIHEVRSERHIEGNVFVPSERVRNVIFPRVAVATRVNVWRILFYCPSGPLNERSLQPVRRLVFMLNECRRIAEVEGRPECIDDTVRVSVVQSGSSDAFSSFACLTRDTSSGPEPTLLMYYRHPSLADAENSKLFRSVNAEMVEQKRSQFLDMFYRGTQLNPKELVAFAESGNLKPEKTTTVAVDDHIAVG